MLYSIEFLKEFANNTESKSICQPEEAHERSLILSEKEIENASEEWKAGNTPKVQAKHRKVKMKKSLNQYE